MMETPATLIEANDDSYERYIFRYIYIYIYPNPPVRATEILRRWGSKGKQFSRSRRGFSRSCFRIVKLLKSDNSSVEQAAISFTINQRFKARIVVLIEELFNTVG